MRRQLDRVWHIGGQRIQPVGVNRLGDLLEPRPFPAVCEQLTEQPGILAVQGLDYPVKRLPYRHDDAES
jgi:hypothetical protein